MEFAIPGVFIGAIIVVGGALIRNYLADRDRQRQNTLMQQHYMMQQRTTAPAETSTGEPTSNVSPPTSAP